ncbi:hypothetical protein AB0K43_18965 [Kitasatospora sp. NPDC049258]|uniref:hypothetical protein n=1 Tax=Kitasatospora sp. NPDC049258 TaxID=3155394 RepID=UPI003416F5AD
MSSNEFAIRYDGWFSALATPLWMGPRRAVVRVSDGVLTVRMGWAFRAEIPLASIRTVGPDSRSVSGFGVHGFGGYWLVNGSAKGLVRLELEPFVRARAVRLPVRLRELRLSVSDPAAFLAAVGR